MKNKYINIIKWSFVFLTVLLIVVCFLLGSSYSNFVYNSNNHRAVEMIVSKLDYKVKVNNEEVSTINLKPGVNLLNIEIESLNEVDTYFKFLVEDDISIFYLDDFLEGMISSNEKKQYRVVALNDSNENKQINYYVASGYINNKLNDIIIPNNYKEISIKFSVLSNFKFNDNNDFSWKLLNIDENYIELISNESIITNYKIEGASGYLNYDEILRTLLSDISKNYSIRSVGIEDIEKYTNQKLVDIKAKNFERDDNFYIPYRNEDNYILNNNYLTNEIIINDKVNESIYDEVFYNTNYHLKNTYSKLYDNYIEWGVLSVENGNIKTNRLYDFNNNENNFDLVLKPIIIVPNSKLVKYDIQSDRFIIIN